MPGVAIVAHILPIAIIVEIVNARHVVTDVVIATVIAGRIIVIRIVQIAIVATIAAIVPARITIAVIVVYHGARLVFIHARERGAGSARTWQRKRLTFFDRAAASISDKLGAAT